MADPRVAKAKRGEQFRRSLPHVSAAALAEIIRVAKSTDLSDIPSSRTGIMRARDVSLDNTPYGEMIIDLPML